MPEFYFDMIRSCKTLSQISAVHTSMANSMTPLELVALCESLVATEKNWAEFQFDNLELDKAEVQAIAHVWLDSLTQFANIDGDAKIEGFVKKFLRPSILYFSDTLPRRNKTLLLCFAGGAQNMIAPVPVFLQQIVSRATDVAILQDPTRNGYRNGLEDVGSDLLSTIESLPKILDTNGFKRVCIIGNGAGGLPAAIAGLRLQPQICMAVAGNNIDDPRWIEPGRNNARELLAPGLIKRSKTQFFYVYGQDNELDKVSAHTLAKVMPGNLIAIEDTRGPVGHNALLPAVEKKQLNGFLQKMFKLES